MKFVRKIILHFDYEKTHAQICIGFAFCIFRTFDLFSCFVTFVKEDIVFYVPTD